MKSLLLLMMLILIGACNKYVEESGAAQQLIGTWEAEQYLGYPGNESWLAGNGRIIVIRGNGDFERRQHDSVIFRGIYDLQHLQDCRPRSSNLLFTTNDSAVSDVYYAEVVDAKLTLSTSNCLADGGTAYYRRLQ